MKPSGHAVILLMVARQAIADARRLWRAAKDSVGLTAAFRACVVAARSAREAAAEWSHDAVVSQRLLDDAERIDDVVADLFDSGALSEGADRASATT